jgi:sugar phosphate isomerase/epimerase
VNLGICTHPDNAAIVAEAGADYIEPGCAATLRPDVDDADWSAQHAQLQALPLPIGAFNVFLTEGKLVGPDADPKRLQRYTLRAAQRAATLGVTRIVVGSGGARRIPDGYAQARVDGDWERFLSGCAQAGEQTGVVFCIEPLNRIETNFINSVSEGAVWVRRMAHAHVQLLADSYHMDVEDEPLRAITDAAGLLMHAHTADSSRVPPGQGVYDHVALFQALHAAGYDQRLSIECNWRDLAAEVGPAVAALRRAATMVVG